jgi:hypothetical protein
MKKSLLLLLLSCTLLSSQSSKAQYYYYNSRYYESDLVFEIGGSAGIMNCLTDIGGKKGIGKPFIKDLNWKNSKLSAGGFIMAMFQNKVGLRLEATFGSIGAYDSILVKVKQTTFGRYERNLSFRSKITDFQLSIEAHPLYILDNYNHDYPPRISPYVVAGIGYFSFDPEAFIDGNWVRLQPLRTEGQGFREYRQRKPYKLNQVNFPIGVGVKYFLNDNLNLRFELIHRLLTTDYLDDVSKTYIDPTLFANYLSPQQAALAERLADRQSELTPGHTTQPGEIRGDPKDKDAFFSVQLKVSFMFGRPRRF